MKIKFFDLAVDEPEEIKKFVESHQIIDVKHSAGPDACPVIVMYEEPNILQQKTFNEFYEDDEVNEFLESHDVIQVDHRPDCCTTVIYRESVGSDD